MRRLQPCCDRMCHLAASSASSARVMYRRRTSTAVRRRRCQLPGALCSSVAGRIRLLRSYRWSTVPHESCADLITRLVPAGVRPRRCDPGRSATTSPGRRLAAVAGPGPDRPLQRGRPAAAMAAVGTAAGLDRVEPRRRLRLGRHQGRSHLRPELERQAEHRRQPEPRRRKGRLVESAGPGGQQRSRIGSARHADHRRRPPLRADRERRLVVSESGRRRRRLAAQHPQGLQRPEHPVAAQRIAAGRRQHGDRHAGRTDAGMVALDKMTGATIWTAKELSDEAGYASVDRRRRAGRADADDDHRQRRGRRARSRTAS